mmetsp:Transcript_42752/g.100494  ORF Transcript_42752/g.100494 Transcript_42752/m.100494 type:complete len:433 (-) Transcript_42752:141-1439(-)
MESGNRLRSARHVRPLCNCNDAIAHQQLGVGLVQLVLRRAGQCHLHLSAPHSPRILPLGRGRVDHVRVVQRILLQPPPVVVLEIPDVGKLVAGDALRVVDPAGRVRQRDRNPPEVHNLLASELCDVAAARKSHARTLERLSLGLQHLPCKVDQAVARGLRPDQRAPVLHVLARQHACELSRELLVHAVHVADLAAPDANVSRWDVDVRSDVPVELGHEGLAKAHDLLIRLALRVEVSAAFASAQRKTRERVLEDLLEAEELEDGEVDGRVKAQAAFVRPDRAAKLHTEPTVDLHLTAVVHPRHAEGHCALWLNQALEKVVVSVFRVGSDDRLQRLEHLPHSLVVLSLIRVTCDHAVIDCLDKICRVLLQLGCFLEKRRTAVELAVQAVVICQHAGRDDSLGLRWRDHNHGRPRGAKSWVDPRGTRPGGRNGP